jgi:NAD(P)H-dependent FMN reductase
MINIALIVGSTRPNRKAPAVAAWVAEIAGARSDAHFDIVDLADYRLPLLDEAAPASFGRYVHAHTRAWAETIARYDGFVLVTPEYNHGPPAALKNALDFLFHEWADKAAGFVSYGGLGGVRAVEQLRLILAELQVATVRTQVSLSLFTDFERFTTFAPTERPAASLAAMLDQLVAWSGALRQLRAGRAAPAQPAEAAHA